MLTSPTRIGDAPAMARANDIVGAWTPWYPRFRLLDRLGRGGWEGEVWLALEGRRLGALKIHDTSRLAATDGRLAVPLLQRLSELEALADVTDQIPGLVRCRSPFLGPPPVHPDEAPPVGQPPQGDLATFAYLPMDVIAGDTLAELAPRLREHRFLEQWPYLNALQDVYDTCEQMASAGVVHGDVHPGNVVIHLAEGRFRAVLVDPGLIGVATAGDTSSPDLAGYLHCVAFALLGVERANDPAGLAAQSEQLRGMFAADGDAEAARRLAQVWLGGNPAELFPALRRAAAPRLATVRGELASFLESEVHRQVSRWLNSYRVCAPAGDEPLLRSVFGEFSTRIAWHLRAALAPWTVVASEDLPEPGWAALWTDPVAVSPSDRNSGAALEAAGLTGLALRMRLSPLDTAARAVAVAAVRRCLLGSDDQSTVQAGARLGLPLAPSIADPLAPWDHPAFAQRWNDAAAADDAAELLRMASDRLYAVAVADRADRAQDRDD